MIAAPARRLSGSIDVKAPRSLVIISSRSPKPRFSGGRSLRSDDVKHPQFCAPGPGDGVRPFQRIHRNGRQVHGAQDMTDLEYVHDQPFLSGQFVSSHAIVPDGPALLKPNVLARDFSAGTATAVCSWPVMSGSSQETWLTALDALESAYDDPRLGQASVSVGGIRSNLDPSVGGVSQHLRASIMTEQRAAPTPTAQADRQPAETPRKQQPPRPWRTRAS